jgi:hypothetical protein
MNNVLDNFVSLVIRMNPILIFIILIICIWLLLYIKNKMDDFFSYLKIFAIELRKLNDNMNKDEKNDKL